jgi:hypothetical protein
MRFAPAPEPYAVSLIACCQDTASSAARAAESSSDLALRVGAASHTLTAAREAVAEQPEAHHRECTAPSGRTSARDPDMGPIEWKLTTMNVTSTRALWRASAVDAAGEQLVHDVAADLAPKCSTPPARALDQPPVPPQQNASLPAAHTGQMSAALKASMNHSELEAEP